MELIKLNNFGKIEMTSRDVAEHFGKDHSNVLRDIRSEIKASGMTEEKAEIFFESGQYKDKNNQFRNQYILSKKGILQITARYDAKARMLLIEKIEELEETMNNSAHILQATQNLINVAADHDNKIRTLEFKVENQITIDHGEQRLVQREANRRVVGRLGGKNSKRYQNPKVRGKYYSTLYGAIYDAFGVSSYRDIKAKDLKDCIKMINAWIEPNNLRIRAVK